MRPSALTNDARAAPGLVKKGPASGGPGAGEVACGSPRRSKLEARDFPYVASRRASRQSTKMRSSLRVPCGARGYGREQSTCRPSREAGNGIGPGFDLERNQAESRLATDDGTKGPPNNLSTAVFGRRKSTVSVMARKINRVDNPQAPDCPISASQAARRGKSRPRRRMPNEQPTIR